jgi:hypothetical protein
MNDGTGQRGLAAMLFTDMVDSTAHCRNGLVVAFASWARQENNEGVRRHL